MTYDSAVLRQVDRLFRGGTVAGLSEWQLLRRYVASRDEAAFEALVARHGPMVWGVCRRMLPDSHDAEDAFQATFLVLVRRAGSLGERDVLALWLYGVASKVALRARCVAARRRIREHPQSEAVAKRASSEDPAVDDLRPVLDDELRRLPDTYRRAVVLCYLEGVSNEEAARQLGWPTGTVKGRLSRARELLRTRLTRRGLAPTAAALALALERDASAAVPAQLLESTVRAALGAVAGRAASGAFPILAAALAEGILRSMIMTQAKVAASVLLVGVVATGAAVFALQDERPSTAGPKNGGAQASTSQSENAAARLQSLARARLQAAERRLAAAQNDLSAGSTSIDRYALASRRLLDAQLDLAASKEERVLAHQAHLGRTREAERIESQARANGRGGEQDLAAAEENRLEAEYLLAREKAGADRSPRDRPPANLALDDDVQTLVIAKKLEQTIPIQFPDETPLEDALRYIQAATQEADGKAIPIYLDPDALMEAEKTPQSPIKLDLEGVPLKITLRLLLEQLGLVYEIKEGMMVITTPGFGNTIEKRVKKAQRGDLSLDEMQTLLEELKAIKEIEKLHPRNNAVGAS